MLSRIVRHDWRALKADATLWILVPIFALSIGYGLYNGTAWVRFQQATLQEAAEEESIRIAELKASAASIERKGEKVAPFRDPRNPEAVGRTLGIRYAAMPPTPLAALSIGQSDLLPYYFKVSTDSREQVVSTSEIENPNRLLSGRFDLAFVIIYLYPLLILALTYNVLSEEKERGTLALTLSQPVSLRTLVTGKVAARGAIFLLLVFGCSLIGFLAGGVRLSAQGVGPRLLLWAAIVAAYGSFWFALAIAIAARGWPSSTNALALAGLWLVLVVLLPSMFNLLATTLYPVPSRVEMIQAVREASDEATEAGSQLLARYYEDHPELAGAEGADKAMNDFNVVRLAVDEDVDRRVRPVVESYRGQLNRQQSIIDALRFTSPAILTQEALNDVAGTGTARHRHFLSQVDRYHAQWRAFFVPLIFQKAQLLDHDRIPRFGFTEESLGSVLRRGLINVWALLLAAFVMTGLGLRWIRRYPVTE